MHNIQRKILERLLYAESLGYAQMRPEGVESNHFAYHLDQLVRSGLVLKKDKRYFLTPQGMAYVDRLSQERMVGRPQPHIVTAIAITTDDGQKLLFKRSFQPYINRVGHPSGKLHIDETLQAAAERELQEKTGLTGIPLTQKGMVYVEAMLDGVQIGKVLYHVFEGHLPKAVPVALPVHRGEAFWGKASDYTAKELMPGFARIEELLASSKTFFYDEVSEVL